MAVSPIRDVPVFRLAVINLGWDRFVEPLLVDSDERFVVAV